MDGRARTLWEAGRLVAGVGRGGFAVSSLVDWCTSDVVSEHLVLVSAGFVVCGAGQAFPCGLLCVVFWSC
jgi:hypothetical protein